MLCSRLPFARSLSLSLTNNTCFISAQPSLNSINGFPAPLAFAFQLSAGRQNILPTWATDRTRQVGGLDNFSKGANTFDNPRLGEDLEALSVRLTTSRQ
jgi:hypothetical protein